MEIQKIDTNDKSSSRHNIENGHHHKLNYINSIKHIYFVRIYNLIIFFPEVGQLAATHLLKALYSFYYRNTWLAHSLTLDCMDTKKS